MTITRFYEVRIYEGKPGKCPSCGKRVTRKFGSTMTVNPWNTRADGTPKSYEEVRADLKARYSAWEPDFEHETCADARGELSQEQARAIVATLGKKPTAGEVRHALEAAATRREATS